MRKYLLLIAILSLPMLLMAQLERKKANPDEKVELTFEAPRLINIFTVEPLEKKGFHYSIMHTFGEVNGGFQTLFGLDNGANVRFSFEYGILDNWSIFAGRSSLDRVVDLGTRYHLIRQTVDGRVPLSVSFAGSIGANTSDYDFVTEGPYTFTDRLSYSAQMMIARKFSDKLSLQVTPMYAIFNRVGAETRIASNETFYFSTAVMGRYKLTPRTALTTQYVPSFNEDIQSNFAIGVDLETGGHVFQLYFTTSEALNEPYLLATQNGDFFAREYRFGFNINRIFSFDRKAKRAAKQ